MVGAGLFGLGGVLDLGWHSVFGIEAGIDALLSPSHLLLFVSAALLFSGPVLPTHRKVPASSAPTLAQVLPAVLALAAVAAFALSYLSMFTTDAPAHPVLDFPEGTPEHAATEVPAIAGLASYVVTSLIVVVALVFLVRLWRLPFGVYTGFLTAIALLAVTVTDFAGASGVAAAVAGLLTDGLSLLAVRMRLSGRTRVLATAVVVPVLLSSAQLVAVQLRLGVRWSAELVGGVVAMSALVSVAVVGVLGWSGQVGEGDRG